jgi:hypothetical protein
VQAKEERQEAEHQAAAETQLGVDDPAGGQPDTEQPVDDMVVDGAGGGVKTADSTVVRRGASGSGHEIVPHDKPIEASADDLIAAYRKDLLAHNTGMLEGLDAVQHSVVVSTFMLLLS